MSVEPYLWPDPPLLKDIGVNKDNGAPFGSSGEDKAKKALLNTMNTFTPSFDSKVPLPKDVDLMQLKKNVWDGKRILLSWTLSLYGSRREAVEIGIRRAGGIVLRYPRDDDENLGTEAREKIRDKKEARAVDECDILITRWRSGRSYGKVCSKRSTSLEWLTLIIRLSDYIKRSALWRGYIMSSHPDRYPVPLTSSFITQSPEDQLIISLCMCVVSLLRFLRILFDLQTRKLRLQIIQGKHASTSRN